MATVTNAYQRMLKVSSLVMETCGPSNTDVTSKFEPRRPPPALSAPSSEWVWSLSEKYHLDTRLSNQLATLVDSCVDSLRMKTLAKYHDAVYELIVVEDIPGLKNENVELNLATLFETTFQRHCVAMESNVRAVLDSMSRDRRSDAKRQGGFDTRAVAVLEVAFSRCQSLTARECTLVAEAAGISHQQVRTWNKRNRGNKSRRTGSTSEIPTEKPLVEPTVPEQRVISALPRRSQQKIFADADAGQDKPATRIVRGLPKRKPAPTVESPAKSETSSLDSIPSSGGFLSPLNATTSNPPIITFPDDHNAFAQTANPWMLGDGIFEPPMDMGGMMPWDAAFNFDLGNFEQSIQAVLDGPTLSGSPALSYGASTNTDGNPIDTPEDEYLKLGLSELDGDELLQMLNNAEYIPSMEEILVDCATAEGGMAARTDWDQMGGNSAEMQLEETVVTVEEVGSSWSGSPGENTPTLTGSPPAGQAWASIDAPAIDDAASAKSTASVYKTQSGSQEQQHATLAPSVIVTETTPSPGADHTQSAYPPQPQQHYLQYSQLPKTAPHPIFIDHVHSSYPYSVPAQPSQVQHIYYAAPLQHVYYALPYPPQPYPPTQQGSAWITGALPFDNVCAHQPVQVVYGVPPHGMEFPTDVAEQHPAQGQAMADGDVWT